MNSQSIAAFLTATIATAAYGHGSMQVPQSRVYLGYHDGVKNSPHAAIHAAIALGGTQPFYDWNEVVNFVPGDAIAQQNADYQALIPDGQIASGGNPKYAGLDLVRDDWPATAVESGPFEFAWSTTTIHNPNIFNAWITTANWNPSMELDWAHLEPLTLGPVEQNGSTYHFSTNLPSRVGKHAIFVIWQRIDPAGEGFYSLSDVDFGSCAADLNLDGVVDGGDMGLLLSAWDTPEADLDGDDVTNGSDLGLLLSAWGSCAPDCDNDGTPDHEEIDAGAPDCNRDGVPDQCQTQEDCDDDGVWDLCAIAEGVVEDCNSNMIPDICELATPGADENGDGILDSCQLDGFTFGWAVDDQWDGGFNGSLSIHNDTDDCLSEWEVLFSTDGFTVETAWNGQLVPSEEGGYRIVNETWNGSLCPGESVTIGIGCSGTPTVPYGVYINGSPVTEEP